MLAGFPASVSRWRGHIGDRPEVHVLNDDAEILVLVVRAGAVDLMRYFVKLYAVRVGLIIFAGIWLRFRDSHWSGLYSLDLVDFLIDKSENGNRFRRPFQNAKCRENGFYISCAEY